MLLASVLGAAGVAPIVGQASAWPPLPPPRFADGMTAAELRTVIAELCPEAGDSGLSDERRAVALRQWIHSFLPVADSNNCLSDMGYDHNAKDLGRMLRAVELRLGGYYCGGHAEIARKIYHLFGFEAFTMNFGFRGTSSTHVTTFVKINHASGPVWSIQDSYLNFTLRGTDGALLGFSALVQALAHDRIDSIVIDDPGRPKTPVLYTHADRVPRLNRRYKLQSECVREWDDFEEFSVRWDFRLMFTTMFDFQRQLEARISRRHPLYMFLVPIGFRGSDTNRQRFFDEAKAAQAILLERVGATPEDLTKTIKLPPVELEPI